MSVENPNQEQITQDLMRYNLVLPKSIFDEVRTVAKEEGTSILSVLRTFIKLGLIIESAQARGGHLILKEGDKQTEIIVI